MIVGSTKKRAPVQQREQQIDEHALQETNDQFILQSIEGRDYSGATTFIEFLRDELNVPYTKDLALWHGYSLFHLGEYSDAIDVYTKLLKEDPEDSILNLYISSCLFYNQDYQLAREYADKGPSCDFKTRLLFHIAHQTNDETQLFQAHSQLIGTLENQLSLAAIHYMRSHYQDAIDIYQKLLIQHPEFLALHVYIAMCQFKLDQFEDSNESVDVYLGTNSDSAVALNLKACDYLRLFDAEIAESQLLQIRKFSSATYDFIDSLIKHNICIFHDGDDGFTILPKLVNNLMEARFNLSVLYMRENNPSEAYNLLGDFQPVDVNESILKATVCLAVGQLTTDAGPIEESNAIFQEIGSMEIIKDTVPGRQCLISSKFINGEYDEVLRIMQTIEQLIGECDEYNYNKGMSLAALSRWAEAERHLLLVKNTSYTREIFYNSWLCRCYIKNRKPDAAWNLYAEATSADDAKTLLQIIASDCYSAGAYYYSMKAYDVLSKYELDPMFKEGMIASSVGVFRNVLSRKETPDKLQDVVATLSTEPDAAQVLTTITQYIETSNEFTSYGY